MEWEVCIGGDDWTDAFYSAAVSLPLNRVGNATVTLDEEPEMGAGVLVKVDGAPVLSGFVRKVRKTRRELYEVFVPEVTARLRDRACWVPQRVSGQMDAVIRRLLSENLDGDAPYIVPPGVLPSVSVSGLLGIGNRLRLIQDVCKMRSTAHGHYEWYFDPAAGTFNVVAFRGTSTPTVTLEEDEDIDGLDIEPTEEVYNRVVVVGVSEGQYAVQAVADDPASQAVYGVREKVIKTSRALTEQEARELAEAYLRIFTADTVRGRAVLHGVRPPVGVGDVINIVDRNGKTYTVRVGAVYYYTGSGDDRTVLRFATFDEGIDELVRTVEDLQSDYAAPSFAPNVFHQTKSDNFDPSHPVVWRVHIPADIDRAARVTLSYRVMDFRSYVDQISASYSGNTGYTAPDGDTDSDYSGSTSPGGDASSERPNIYDATVSGNTQYPEIGGSGCSRSTGSATRYELDDGRWYNISGTYLPSTYYDYGSIIYAYTFIVEGTTTGLSPHLRAEIVLYNSSRYLYVPSSYSGLRQFTVPQRPVYSGEDITLTLNGITTFTYPPSWSDDYVYLRVKAEVDDIDYDELYVYCQALALGYDRHYHYFSDEHDHSQAYHDHYISVDSHSHYIPSLDVDVDSHRHSVNISDLSATVSPGVTTSPYSGTHTVEVDGQAVYTGTDAEKTVDVTQYLTPGWHTVVFRSTGKGYVDMVLEAKGRLRTV